MMKPNFKLYNSRPKDWPDGYPWIEKGGDCIVRAMSTALPMTYNQAFDLLTANANGKASDRQRLWNCRQTLEYLGLKREAPSRDCTVKTFARESSPVDAFIVFVSHHAVAVIGSKYIDTWDSGSRHVKEFYRVTFEDWKRLTGVFTAYKGGKIRC